MGTQDQLSLDGQCSTETKSAERSKVAVNAVQSVVINASNMYAKGVGDDRDVC